MQAHRRHHTHALARAAAAVLVVAIARPVQPAEPLHVEAAARALQPGELVVFTITAPVDASMVRVTAFARTVRAFQDDGQTWRALVGIDLLAKPGPTSAVITARTPRGSVTATHAFAVLPKQFPTRRLTVDPALVEPPPSELERIQRETARTNQIYASPAPAPLWAGAFMRPVGDPSNSRFGVRSIFNGRPGSPHTGADFLSGAGTPIKAPNAGRVRLAENLYFSGNTVIVDHGLGLFSIFAHLSAFNVKEGGEVGTGDLIGLVGATGRVTGPHLHWAVRASGARVDPLSVLEVLGEKH